MMGMALARRITTRDASILGIYKVAGAKRRQGGGRLNARFVNQEYSTCCQGSTEGASQGLFICICTR
jgi:hypothetical protein